MEEYRCHWAKKGIFHRYHDKEWGIPVHKDIKLFELLLLEGAQAGLSWETILKKRGNYKKAFDNFNYRKISRYQNEKILELLKNEGIIRNKLKIASSIINAKNFINIQKEFGSFDKYIWGFTNGKRIINNITSKEVMITNSKMSNRISKDLKERGFKFVGATIIYSYMQAIGIIDDHENKCFRKNKI